MKKYFTAVLIIALTGLTQSCFRQEAQTEEYLIPNMKTPAASAYIQNRIKGLPGVVESSSNLDTHIFSVTYNSSIIRTMNIEETIALSGFSVNGRPANSNAKIPEGVK
jgi:hypothetical protein